MFNLKDVQEFSAMKPEPRKEGCMLKGVKREKDEKNPNVNNAMTISFVDRTGAILNHREFVPRRLPQQSEEDFRKSINLTVSRLTHIAKAFIPKEIVEAIGVQDPNNLNLVEENFIAVTNQIGKLLVDLIKEAEQKGNEKLICDLKVVYRGSGNPPKYYSSLPAVPPFISTKLNPKEFVNNPQYDLYEIPAVSHDKERTSVADQGKGPGMDFGGGGFSGNMGLSTPPPVTPPPAEFGASGHESGF